MKKNLFNIGNGSKYSKLFLKGRFGFKAYFNLNGP